MEEEHPHYRYGGMVSATACWVLYIYTYRWKADVNDGQWKDRSADGPASAKKPRKVKERQKEEAKSRHGLEESI